MQVTTLGAHCEPQKPPVSNTALYKDFLHLLCPALFTVQTKQTNTFRYPPSANSSAHRSTHQHICCMEVVLARHVRLQSLRHLLDALDFIQELEDMLVLDAFDPQLPQLVPLAVKQHLTRQEILLHLQRQTRLEINTARQNICSFQNVWNILWWWFANSDKCVLCQLSDEVFNNSIL